MIAGTKPEPATQRQHHCGHIRAHQRRDRAVALVLQEAVRWQAPSPPAPCSSCSLGLQRTNPGPGSLGAAASDSQGDADPCAVRKTMNHTHLPVTLDRLCAVLYTVTR